MMYDDLLAKIASLKEEISVLGEYNPVDYEDFNNHRLKCDVAMYRLQTYQTERQAIQMLNDITVAQQETTE